MCAGVREWTGDADGQGESKGVFLRNASAFPFYNHLAATWASVGQLALGVKRRKIIGGKNTKVIAK